MAEEKADREDKEVVEVTVVVVDATVLSVGEERDTATIMVVLEVLEEQVEEEHGV